MARTFGVSFRRYVAAALKTNVSLQRFTGIDVAAAKRGSHFDLSGLVPPSQLSINKKSEDPDRLDDFHTGLLMTLLKDNSLEKQMEVTHLQFRGNQIGDKGYVVAHDVRGIRVPCVLVFCKVCVCFHSHSCSHVVASGVDHRLGFIVDYINYTGSVVAMDLSHNTISDIGAAALANMLKTDVPLLTMNLSGNAISDAGAIAIADALRTNSTLQFLDLSYNRIGTAGLDALISALHPNKELTSLLLQGNSNYLPLFRALFRPAAAPVTTSALPSSSFAAAVAAVATTVAASASSASASTTAAAAASDGNAVEPPPRPLLQDCRNPEFAGRVKKAVRVAVNLHGTDFPVLENASVLLSELNRLKFNMNECFPYVLLHWLLPYAIR
jgi:hypothetical protein